MILLLINGEHFFRFAPIRDRNDKVVAIIGMDIQIDDFLCNSKRCCIYFYWVMLLLLLSFQTLTIVRIWKNRATFVKDLDRQKTNFSIVSHQPALLLLLWYPELLQDDTTGSERRSNFWYHAGITATIFRSCEYASWMCPEFSRQNEAGQEGNCVGVNSLILSRKLLYQRPRKAV